MQCTWNEHDMTWHYMTWHRINMTWTWNEMKRRWAWTWYGMRWNDMNMKWHGQEPESLLPSHFLGDLFFEHSKKVHASLLQSSFDQGSWNILRISRCPKSSNGIYDLEFLYPEIHVGSKHGLWFTVVRPRIGTPKSLWKWIDDHPQIWIYHPISSNKWLYMQWNPHS